MHYRTLTTFLIWCFVCKLLLLFLRQILLVPPPPSSLPLLLLLSPVLPPLLLLLRLLLLYYTTDCWWLVQSFMSFTLEWWELNYSVSQKIISPFFSNDAFMKNSNRIYCNIRASFFSLFMAFFTKFSLFYICMLSNSVQDN